MCLHVCVEFAFSLLAPRVDESFAHCSDSRGSLGMVFFRLEYFILPYIVTAVMSLCWFINSFITAAGEFLIKPGNVFVNFFFSRYKNAQSR